MFASTPNVEAIFQYKVAVKLWFMWQQQAEAVQSKNSWSCTNFIPAGWAIGPHHSVNFFLGACRNKYLTAGPFFKWKEPPALKFGRSKSKNSWSCTKFAHTSLFFTSQTFRTSLESDPMRIILLGGFIYYTVNIINARVHCNPSCRHGIATTYVQMIVFCALGRAPVHQ